MMRSFTGLSDQFVTADKYVFVTPLWNLSFPSVMKAYFDAVAIPGKAFRYSDMDRLVF